MVKLEICASSIESVLEAERGGATRVELCDNLAEGGTTPPLSWIQFSIQNTNIQIFAIIRPRGGDFLYSDNEFVTMKEDIIQCGKVGCHGVVLGILTKEGKVDKKRCSELIQLAKKYNLSVTFHRAIDRTKDILEAMEDIISLGCDRILTSGGKESVEEGKDVIRKMIDQSRGRITIMPGGGINENNIAALSKFLKTDEFHGSFRTQIASKMLYKNEVFESDYITMVSSSEKIKEALKRVNGVSLPINDSMQ